MEIRVNNQELAEKIAGVGDLSKADARKVVDAVFNEIASAVASGDDVAISGFGKFSLKLTAERVGRNPATGAEIQIPAGKKAGFQAAKALKDRLSA